MEPPRIQSPFAQCRRYLYRRDVFRLFRGRYSSVIALTDSCTHAIWLSSPSALASFEESLQVAIIPCCQRHVPDVISENLSSVA